MALSSMVVGVILQSLHLCRMLQARGMMDLHSWNESTAVRATARRRLVCILQLHVLCTQQWPFHMHAHVGVGDGFVARSGAASCFKLASIQPSPLSAWGSVHPTMRVSHTKKQTMLCPILGWHHADILAVRSVVDSRSSPALARRAPHTRTDR
ncbi:hypothetical protein P171DRAFT_230369 [Karstenula rhodostoma CBS 690.94]|uniref:Secreted protein n=1 Tax=Karstenula rhodostoma CBS 690.94 TaxID=1392251 RepID=A0A9P4PNY6_9PLEO|nr:hypothetical protein P171DRAFT_230369 [Karstenula rhodostoma CBS 690.94]